MVAVYNLNHDVNLEKRQEWIVNFFIKLFKVSVTVKLVQVFGKT